MNHNQKVGFFGQKIAKKYLIKRGYRIIDENIQAGKQEIDILAKIKDFLIFVEVKTRASDVYGSAEDSISSHKTGNLRRAMTKYVYKNKIDPDYIRFDLIAIDINKSTKIAKIKHYKDIL